MNTKSKMTEWSLVLAVVFGAFLVACGGGGGSDNGGTSSSSSSSSSSGTAQARSVVFSGEIEDEIADAQGRRKPYPGYQVCAFASCTTTNEAGKFTETINVPTGAVGIEITVSGPEFSTIVGFPIQSDAGSIDSTLVRRANQSTLLIAEVKFDGVVDDTISAGGFNDGD